MMSGVAVIAGTTKKTKKEKKQKKQTNMKCGSTPHLLRH